MWINADVDLPQPLLAAQREGRLVVFAGAGVSMGDPSNLPSFDSLATSIAGGVLTPNPGEGLDAFLGRLEQRGIDVQARTRAIIDRPTSQPRLVHERIMRLFANDQSVRIVTTNFDRHFTTTARAIFPNTEIFIGPALPLGREAVGVIYVHGAVERATSHLVITDRDFGQAYLADGWATRFLMEMFREFAVLFIGYSHQDLVMKYLARSFAGPTARFALTPAGDDEFWTNLGITPVHFPRRPGTPNPYGAIDDALQSWVTLATMGVLDHQARIARLVATPPTPDPEASDYLRNVVGNGVTLRFFIESAERLEWFEWAEAEGFLAPLASTAPLSQEARTFAAWIADKFAIAHQAAALDFVRRHAPQLNPVVCEAVAFRVAHATSGATADALRLWAAALLTIPTTPISSLTRLMRRCAELGDVRTTALLFRALVHPQLQFEAPWPGDNEPPLRLSVEMSVRGEEYDLREVWRTTILPNLADLHSELLPTVTTYLIEASSLLVAAGRAYDGWDPMSHRRAAVEPHGQDHIAQDWGLLIDIARELINWTVAHDAPGARRIVDVWSNAPQQLLVRLAIYGLGELPDIAPNDVLAMIEERRWLYRLSYKHEVFELLRKVFPRTDDEAKRRFIQHSMTANVLPPETVAADADARRVSDYERYNIAVWLNRVAPDSEVALAHLSELQRQHADFAPRDHPDMDRWIGDASYVGPNSPTAADELVAMTPADAAVHLSTYQPDDHVFGGPDRNGLLRTFEQTATGAIQWSLGVADALVARGLWTADVWGSLLGAWRSATLDDARWHRVLTLLETHPDIITGSPDAAATFIEHAVQRRDIPIEDLERLERLGERVLTVTDGIAPGVTDGDGVIDWMTSAINHPAGRVAESWINALGRRITIAGDQWRGLSPSLHSRFSTVLGGTGNNAVMARVIFASQVGFLLSADRTWTEANVIPLFDWSVNELRAAQAWDGFLTWGRWSDPLVERLQPYLRQTFTRVATLDGRERTLVSGLASVAAFSTEDPWHGGWLFEFMQVVAPDERARWADEFGRYIESLSAAGQEALWMRWLSEYWQERITGVPHQLDELERRAMVSWLPGLRPRLAEVIDRILAAPPATLDHFMFYRLHQARVAEENGQQIGRLLRNLLPQLTAVNFDFGEVAELANQAADNGAERDDLRVIANEMARLGCAGATELLNRANT